MTITIKKKMEILNQKKIFNGFDDFHLQKKSLIIYNFPIDLSLHNKNFNGFQLT